MSEHEERRQNKKAKANDYIFAGIAILVLVVAAIQAFQINAIKQEIVKKSSSASQGQESYDQMMARMHPELAKSAASGSSGSQMVGGC